MGVIAESVGPVRQLTLDCPDAANAIGLETVGELTAAIDAFTVDDGARVLVITGAGERSFCGGGDLGDMLKFTRRTNADRTGALGFARRDPGKPTIAAINGHCVCVGFELALWCDFRVAARNASFAVLNRASGMPLVDGGTQRLPRIVGYGNAMWLINTGIHVDAETGLRIGLVQELVHRGQALARALEFAQHIAEVPQSGLLADRRSVVAGASLTLAEGLDLEARIGRAVLSDHPGDGPSPASS